MLGRYLGKRPKSADPPRAEVVVGAPIRRAMPAFSGERHFKIVGVWNVAEMTDPDSGETYRVHTTPNYDVEVVHVEIEGHEAPYAKGDVAYLNAEEAQVVQNHVILEPVDPESG